MDPISSAQVRFIKLGPGDAWFGSSLENDRIEFGHREVPHEMAQEEDWDAIVDFFVTNQGRTNSKAKDFMREIKDFYSLGSDCLWITFARGHLWWAFAAHGVHLLGDETETTGFRYRSTISPWSNCNIFGEPLRQPTLSTRLTQVAGYRQTICKVAEAEYLLRKINGVEEPIVAHANKVREELLDVAESLIARLHWRDFEMLVDLIFARSGWQRISETGGGQKDIDIAIEQTVTGERAFVQVKSRASASTLRDYIERFDEDDFYSRMFFVCHSPDGDLDQSADPAVSVWNGRRLAVMAVMSGLFDWLLEKAA